MEEGVVNIDGIKSIKCLRLGVDSLVGDVCVRLFYNTQPRLTSLGRNNNNPRLSYPTVLY